MNISRLLFIDNMLIFYEDDVDVFRYWEGLLSISNLC